MSLTKATYSMINGACINVKDFGAVGDGATNDTAAVQAAINKCLQAPFPALYFPAGSYYVRDGVVVDGTNDPFTMFGDGRRSDIYSDQAVNTVDLKGSLGNTFQYPLVKDLAIRNTNAAGTAIRTRHTEFLKVVRCVIAGGLNGMMMSEFANETDIKPQIHDCVFGFSANGLKGGDTRVADAVVRDNIFLDCTTTMMDFGFLDGGTIAGNKLFSNNAGSNAVVGMRFKKPIYVVVEDNAFFELGGVGLQLTSPRYSRFKNNQIINVGQNANGSAIQVLDFDAITPGFDVQITGNTIKDTNGTGIFINSSASIQTEYLIADNYFEKVGDGGVIYDAILLQNCNNFRVRGNIIDGKSVTRHWLYLDASTNIEIDGNTYRDCINADVFRANTPTMLFKQGVQNNLNVTATATLVFNDDTALCDATAGAITINLPSAASCPGKIYRIGKKDASVNAVTIDPAAAQTIDGAATLAISTQYQVATIMSDGANWITVSV
jgi:hypothetical protein